MEYILTLTVLLVTAKLFGELCERIGFPSLLGYISAGIIAGPMFFNIATPEDIHVFAELGIILLLFITGFTQGDVRQLIANKKAIALVSFLGFMLPYLMVLCFMPLLGFTFNQMLFFALVLAATDSGITLKSLASTGRMADRVGRVVLGVTVADGLFGLAIFTGIMSYLYMGAFDFFQMGKVLFLIILFLGVFILLQKIIPWVVRQIKHLTVEEASFSFAFVFMLFLAIVAKFFGLDGIIGAFLAGMILSRSALFETNFIKKISSASYSIFIPLFFVWTGLLLNIKSVVLIQVALVFGVLLANAIGAFVAGKVCGMKTKENIIMACTLLPRGDINLVIATIGLSMVGMTGELIIAPGPGEFIYSTTMILIVTGAVVTPLLLKIFGGVKK